VINFVGNHGSSLKGLMAYLLHDQDHATTSERVAWTETCNLASSDPEKAWRIAAATAMAQPALKAAAGIKNTGRKSHKTVFHYSLSWSREHDPDLTKEEMIAAAKASMTYLGTYEGERLGRSFTKEGRAKKKRGEKLTKSDYKTVYATRTQSADEHQAIIVCHDEPGKNPHVHVAVNRVNPEHGVMLPDHYEKEKLSAWALDYRTSQGKEHLCPARVINAAKKARGVITNHPRKPRHIYEQEKAMEAADPGSRKKVQIELQREKAKELKATTVQMERDHKDAIHGLEETHVEAIKTIKAKAGHAIKAKVKKISNDYAPELEKMLRRHQDERLAFKESQKTLGGKLLEGLKAVRAKEWISDFRERRFSVVSEGIELALKAGLQEIQLKNFHSREEGKHNGDERRAIRGAIAPDRKREAAELAKERKAYTERRNDLILTNMVERAKLDAEWNEWKKVQLAIEIEDQQALDPEAKHDTEQGESSSSSGGHQPSKRPNPRADLQEQDKPLKPDYDVPIEELKEKAKQKKKYEKAMARRAKKRRAQNRDNEKDGNSR